MKEEIRIKVEKLNRQNKRFGQMTVDQLRDRIEELEEEVVNTELHLTFWRDHCQKLRNAIADCIPLGEPCGDQALIDYPAKMKAELEKAQKHLEESLANQRHAFGKEYDTLNAKLKRVQESAFNEINRLEARVAEKDKEIAVVLRGEQKKKVEGE